MRYNVSINQKKGLSFGLTVHEVAVMELLFGLDKWADRREIDGQSYYYITRSKIIMELPLFFSSADSVYRLLVCLHNKGMIVYWKQGKQKRDYVRLTEKGHSWRGSEKIAKGSTGKKQKASVINPPIEERALDYIRRESPKDYEIWMRAYKERIKDFKRFVANFNDTFDIEGRPYSSKVIFARLDKYACNWISRQDMYNRSKKEKEEPLPPYLTTKIK